MEACVGHLVGFHLDGRVKVSLGSVARITVLNMIARKNAATPYTIQ